MGVFSTVTGVPTEENNSPSPSSLAHYGGHSLSTGNVLNAVNDAVTPTTEIHWATDAPPVLHTPVTATLDQADEAERKAAEYEQDVENGLRRLKAEGKKQKAHAKLVRGHRSYMGETAQSHYEIASSNKMLANKLHSLRTGYAELGFGLDRQQERATDAVDLIARKYGGVR